MTDNSGVNDSMPGPFQPMLACPGELPRDAAAYGYEVKWDGVRAMARIDHGRLGLTGRNGTDFTPRYPEIQALAGVRRMILDGEVVAFDPEGRPSFERLQSRIHLASGSAVRQRMSEVPVTYVIFDLLWLEGHSTVGLPYRDRRSLLVELGLSGPSWRTPAHREGDGAALLEASREHGLEGVVAKRLDSVYEPGRRSRSWIKVKNSREQDVVIGGFTAGAGGRASSLGALVVGVHDADGALRYAGKVGSGFSDSALGLLGRELDPLRAERSPFEGRQPQRGTTYVAPRLVARVEFREWTRTGTLRAPTYKGLRADVDPRSVVRET